MHALPRARGPIARFAMFLALSCSTAIPAAATRYPGFISGVTDSSLVFTVPSVPRPAYLTAVTEPTFGARVTRIGGDSGQPLAVSSSGESGVWGSDARHHYSKDQPWNADGTLLAIENGSSTGGTPARLLLDGETYEPRYGRCAYTLDDSRWHPSLDHAFEMIGVREATDSLVWFNPVACTQTRGWKLPIKPSKIGFGEGNASADGRYLAIANATSIVVVDMDPQAPFASYADGNRRRGPVYTLPACSLSTSQPTSCAIGNISISPSGRYIDVKYSGPTTETQDAHRIFEVDPITLAIKPHNMADASARCGTFQSRPNGWIFPLKHADMTLDPFDQNEDVVIGGRSCSGSSIGRVVKVRLRDGAVIALTSPDNEASVRHVSARNLDRPGWAYVSYYRVAGKRFNDEIIAVKLDGSRAVQRFAHTHSLVSSCYRCEPHAVPSRDGRRVLWASNWAQDCSACGSSTDIKGYIIDARDVATFDRAPVVDAADSVAGFAGAAITVDVAASDPDGDAITTLIADLTALPAGHDAQFTPDAAHRTGRLTWTPRPEDIRDTPYSVSFIASNALGDTTTTTLRVDLDHPPLVQAADSVTVFEGSAVNVDVVTSDPDGQPIESLTADLSALPAGNDAVFAVQPASGTGRLTWTPTHADGDRTYAVTFRAANSLAGSDTTWLVVTNLDRPPTIAAPDTGRGVPGTPIEVRIVVSDPDGDPIESVTADLAQFPEGSNAVFVVDPGNLAGTLRWTPVPADVRPAAYAVTFLASNAANGTASTAIVVSRVDFPPIVAAPESATAAENQSLVVNVEASDPDGDPIETLVANFSALPPGSNAQFEVNASRTGGTLTWTPGFADGGRSYAVNFTATNSLGGSATTSLLVTNVDRAPVLTAPTAATAPSGAPMSIGVSAIDPDGEPLSSFTADLSGLPPGNDASFIVNGSNTAGTLTWTPADVDAGNSWPVTFHAANALLDSVVTSITVTSVDHPPLVSAPASATVIENGVVTVNVSASDANGEPITSLTADFSGLPVGHDAQFTAAADNISGTLTWRPTYQDERASPYSVTFRAQNALAGTASTSIMVTHGDAPPVVAAPASSSVSENSKLTIGITATDPDGSAVTQLTADLSQLPAGHNAVFSTNVTKSTGTLTWTPTYQNGRAQPYAVVFTARNALSASGSTSILVTHVDRAPVVTAPSSAKATAGAALTVNVTASDPDGDAIESLIANLSALPTGHTATFTVDSTRRTGTLRWTPRSSETGNYKLTFTAANGLSGSASTTLRVSRPGTAASDPTAPESEVTSVPQRLSLSPAFPNPSTRSVRFVLDLPARAPASFSVHDLQGRILASERTIRAPGTWTWEWSGIVRGDRARPGVYLLRVQVAESVFVRRFVIVAGS